MKKKINNKNSSVFLDEDIDGTIDESLERDISQSIDIVNRNREELDSERNSRINKFERNANGMMIERPKVRYRININTILIIIAFIILVTWIIYDYGPIFGIKIGNKENLNENVIELVTKDSDIYGMYNEQLYVYSNNTITTYDKDGEVTWTYNFSDSFTPNILVEGKYMLVTNNSTGTLYLFESYNEILNKKIDGVIKNAFLDKYGNMALEYSNSSGYNNIISVYDKKGKNKYDAYLSQENIISMEMLNNAQQVVFCEAVTDSSNIGVKFRIIDISKKEEEQLRDIISLDNQFIYDFKVEGKNIYALLDNQIVKVDIDTGNLETLKELDNTQMLFVKLNANYYSYIERELSDNKYIIENVAYNGSKISTTLVDSVPKSIVCGELVNYYIYQDYVYILNKWGVELQSRNINITPKKCIVFNEDKSLALIYTNKIYIVNL